MRGLTSRAINLGLSKGWGIEEFIENYGFSNTDELKEELGKVHNNDQKKVNRDIKSMKTNSKRNRKRSNSVLDESDEVKYMSVKADSMVPTVPYTTVDVPRMINAAEENIQRYEVTVVSTKSLDNSNSVNDAEALPVKTTGVGKAALEAIKADNSISAVAVSEPDNSTIEEIEADDNVSLELLEGKLKLVNEQIMSSESSTKTLFARKRVVCKTVDDIAKSLGELEKEVMQQKAKFEKTYAEHIAIEQEIQNEKTKMNDLQQEKEDIMAQMRELMAVSLYCGVSTNTERSFDYTLETIDIDTQAVNMKLKSFFESEFSESELLDEFSVMELKRIARIILAAEKIEEETNVELWFDTANNLTGLLELMGKKVKILNN